ncbi:MAG: PorT family protein, partial [Bacteroidota bacterium]|nr:PorT family protein [Bacteroidota bacterium]
MKLKKLQICIRGLILIGLLTMLAAPVYSQRFSAGIVGGFNASQIDGAQLAGFDKLGLTGGLKAIVNFESRFALNIEFLYSQRGSRPDIFSPEYDPNINILLHYAELPVYVSLGDWWQEEGEYYKVSAHAGFSYG